MCQGTQGVSGRVRVCRYVKVNIKNADVKSEGLETGLSFITLLYPFTKKKVVWCKRQNSFKSRFR